MMFISFERFKLLQDLLDLKTMTVLTAQLNFRDGDALLNRIQKLARVINA